MEGGQDGERVVPFHHQGGGIEYMIVGSIVEPADKLLSK